MISVGALDANNTNSINTNASTAERMAGKASEDADAYFHSRAKVE